jgi:hypothetical protein
MNANNRHSITDSPWYWVLLFSVVGLLALVLIGGQYGRRQARLDRQYQARERVMEDAVGDPSRRGYSTPEATLVPLWPLAVVLGGVAVVATAMLIRGRCGRGRCDRGRGRPGSLENEGAPP